MSNMAPFHVAFGVDSNFLRPMGVTMVSLIQNNPDISFVFHVLTFAISDADRDRLHQLETQFGVKVYVYVVDAATFGGGANFIRWLIPETLRDITDKVLYLDADILCFGSIKDLVEMDISKDIAAVVSDTPEIVEKQCRLLGLRHGKYFNSGMLYINIPNWISQDITSTTMRLALEGGRTFTFRDQDPLNIVLDGRTRYIDTKWDFLYNLQDSIHDNVFSMRPLDDVALVHFAARIKPWHGWSMHEAKDIFLKYQSLSPWAGMPLLDTPRNHKEMHRFSVILRKKRRFFSSVRWYVKYLIAKYLPKPAYKST